MHARLFLLIVFVACGPRTLMPVAGHPDGSPTRADAPSFGLPPPSDATAGDIAAATCAAQSYPASRGAVDLLFLVDVGPTIHDPFPMAMESKFFTAKKAIFNFLMDPQSAGIGVALQFFPFGYIDKPCLEFRDCGRDKDLILGNSTTYSCIKTRFCAEAGQPPGTWVSCAAGMTGGRCDCRVADMCSGLTKKPTTCVAVGECSLSHLECPAPGQPCAGGMAGDMCAPRAGTCLLLGDGCDPTMYEQLAVPFGDLPAAAKPMLDRLDLTDVQAGFSSPTSAAVKGAMTVLQKRAAMPGARASALVLVTEAKAAMRNCNPGDPLAAMSDLTVAAAGKPGIPTYVIGLLSDMDQAAGRENLNRLAAAGGTGTPFVLDQADGAIAKFQDALGRIRAAVLPCELAIPEPTAGAGPLDYKKVNVTLVGSTKQIELGYTGKAASCRPTDGGWYYDVDPAAGKPSRIILCPASCQALKGDAQARADLAIGCATKVIE